MENRNLEMLQAARWKELFIALGWYARVEVHG